MFTQELQRTRKVENWDVSTAVEYLVKTAKAGPESVVFLTGAGISASSEHSLWQAMKLDLFADIFGPKPAEQLESMFQEKAGDPEFLKNHLLQAKDAIHAIAIAKLVQHSRDLPSELLMSFYRTRYGLLELHDFLKRHFVHDKPAPAYAALCRLLAAGFARHYITTNQDGAIERALTRWFPETTFTSLVHKGDFEFFLTDTCKPDCSVNEASRVIVANLHGVYTWPETLMISPSNLVVCPPSETPTCRAFERMIEKARVLVIIGYRGVDLDVVGVLKRCLSEGKTNIECIIAVGPDTPMPEVIKEARVSLGLVEVASLADTFLTTLFEEWIRGLQNFAPAKPPASNSAYPTVCASAPGAVILAGDYGVFVNGKMIQLQLPHVRVFATRVPEKQEKPARFFDPRTHRWVADDAAKKIVAEIQEFIQVLGGGPWPKRWDKLTEGIKPRVEERITRLKDMISKAGLTPICDASVLTWSQYPTGSGAGDGLAAVALAALLLPDPGTGHGWDRHKGDESVHTEDISGDARTALVEATAIFSWFYHYQNTSYLRPLASFWNGNPIFLLNRTPGETEESKKHRADFTGREFELANFGVDPHAILHNGQSFDISGEVIEFAIAYRPRRAVLAKQLETKVGTATAVAGVKKSHIHVQTLALFTEAMAEALNATSPDQWITVGKLMTAAHFGLVTIARGSPEVDGLVGELAAMQGILGAKTTGSGPGGAMVVAYEPRVLEKLPMNEQFRRLVLRRGHRIITTKVLS